MFWQCRGSQCKNCNSAIANSKECDGGSLGRRQSCVRTLVGERLRERIHQLIRGQIHG